jgi:hypothetical protein
MCFGQLALEIGTQPDSGEWACLRQEGFRIEHYGALPQRDASAITTIINKSVKGTIESDTEVDESKGGGRGDVGGGGRERVVLMTAEAMKSRQ